MTLSKDRLGGILLLIFCLIYGYLSQEIRLLPFQRNAAFTARTMPEALTIIGVGLSLLLIVFPARPDTPQIRGLLWGKTAIFLALMSAYGLTIRPMGFLLSTSLFLIIGFALLGERRPVILLAVAVPLVFAFWALMTQGLDVFIEPLPAFMKG